MNAPDHIDDACFALAEDLLAAELARTGADLATSAAVLSLATVVQRAVDQWYADRRNDEEESTSS